jgi:hypothetical protein
MIGLVLAAAVAGPATPAAQTPNLYSQPANCPAVVEREVRRQQVALQGRARSGLQYAVWRRLEGCSVPTPVGYHPTYTAPGAADSPLRREDAPADRR